MKKLRDYVVMTDQGYKELKKSIVAMMIKNLAIMIPYFVLTWIISILLEGYQQQRIEWVHVSAAAFLGLLLAIVIAVIFRVEYKMTNIPTYYESERNRIRMIEKLRRVPMSYFNQKNLAELSETLMSDCATLESFYSGLLPRFIASFFSIPMSFVMLAVFDWRLALAAFCTVPPAFLVLFSTMRYQKTLSIKQMTAKKNLDIQIRDYIEGIADIRANRMVGEHSKSLFGALKELRRLSMKMELLSGVFVAGSDVILEIGIGIVILLSATFLAEGEVSLLAVIFFFSVILSIYEPIAALICAIPSFMYSSLGTERIRELLETESIKGDKKPVINCFDLSFEQVGFGYKEDTEVLHNICFIARQGQITALVGPSGGGKSSILHLAARFWDPLTGKITLDGHKINEIDLEYYGEFISCVLQEVVLFHDTVLANIRLGRPDASEEEVYEAAKAAGCDGFVRKLPKGYQTILEENGSSLSGGERQRISIARAILKNAPIILLDEATSALDPENETQIQEAISKLVENKTVLIVAHRLRNIIEADQILMVESGRIIERGTHEELMKKEGAYHRMFQIQQKGLRWEWRE